MKYIKKFETLVYSDEEEENLHPIEKEYLKDYKFKRGDYVRINQKGIYDSQVGQILGVDVDSYLDGGQYSVFDLKGEFIRWFYEFDLEKIEEWEAHATKYNL